MKIIYKKGDLLQCPEKYILHGCNAQGVMGSGVAKLIREKYPSAYLAYKASEKHGGMKFGVVTYAEQEDGKVIFNGITQEFYGRDGRRYVDYDAVRDVIQVINWHIFKQTMPPDMHSVAMPKIGAGLGGGDWDVISEIIELNSMYFQPVVYEL
jgi:O-acetyl-ADP-ribose deacetylase (regulator of RNase III)